jgi:hypothetical protein
MWKGNGRKVRFLDLDPSVRPDVVASFLALPFRSASFDVVIFDPPHLPVAAASTASHPQMVGHYGLASSLRADNVSAWFVPFLTEARRVLSADGLVFAKLKDFVHNHRYQWTLTRFVQAVESVSGLAPCDLIVKRDPCGGNLKSGRWVKQHHARNAHCWWVVVRKGKCERRAAPRPQAEARECNCDGGEQGDGLVAIPHEPSCPQAEETKG